MTTILVGTDTTASADLAWREPPGWHAHRTLS